MRPDRHIQLRLASLLLFTDNLTFNVVRAHDSLLM